MSKVFNMVGGGVGKNISSIIITGLSSTDTVTCTKDGKSYPATWDDTAQHWEIVGLPLGTFSLTATNGTKTSTKTVLIDIAGVYEIEMFYKPEGALYWLGDECEDVTGGWVGNYTLSGHTITSATKQDNSIEFNDTSKWLMLGTNNLISFSGYSKLCIEYIPTSIDSNDVLFVGKGKTNYTASSDFIAKEYLNGDTSRIELSVSSLQNGYVSVFAYYFGNFEVTKIWLE